MPEEKIVVTVCVTGAFGDAGTPHIPITPEQIAQSAIEAGQAGASVAHIHVRNPEDGVACMDFELYQEVVERIRAGSDLIINLTTGAGARIIPTDTEPVELGQGSTLSTPQRRAEHVLKLKPELCSLDVGTMDFGPHIFAAYGPHIEAMAEMIRDAGIVPEVEVFTLGHIEIAKRLIKMGLIKNPPLIQLCMGIPWGIPANTTNLLAMIQALPADALWTAFAISKDSFPLVAQSAILGGNVRVGMEDNLYLEKGVRATSNAQLVEKAVNLVRILGKEPATPDEARELLKLK
ncbi:MAG: 3-keto-5-aminohexanoate cleavage protein [Desulfarculaceae bacterium]|nr:3-keto-5-aminohexanoate cleavage protein [Desulfarculaceae bacterium]MCF8072447.1 3-keto-5-aminohexanoate cleavage protein [Desulfarculaceae bacterium]MCF8102908.1 3-keto-5-aminohexanoate cleavage protein [Desulfarculaceae bacterium]MCF8118490.1 3-keto-5-aminohexanoate cleavage protein [Desulfarculaceae bacterium]